MRTSQNLYKNFCEFNKLSILTGCVLPSTRHIRFLRYSRIIEMISIKVTAPETVTAIRVPTLAVMPLSIDEPFPVVDSAKISPLDKDLDT